MMPAIERSSASFNMELIWPWKGRGKIRTWGACGSPFMANKQVGVFGSHQALHALNCLRFYLSNI